MDMENTSIRLRRIMEIKNLKQVDLLELVKPYCKKYNIKMNKSDISQYLSNKTKPNQEKLAVLSMALGVNESWLMGFNVEMKRVIAKSSTITKEEKQLLDNFNKLNDTGKVEANKRVAELTEITKYTYTAPITIAAHDDDLTEDEKDEMNRRIEEFKKNRK